MKLLRIPIATILVLTENRACQPATSSLVSRSGLAVHFLVAQAACALVQLKLTLSFCDAV
jgi:hypothetical protein